MKTDTLPVFLCQKNALQWSHYYEQDKSDRAGQ